MNRISGRSRLTKMKRRFTVMGVALALSFAAIAIAFGLHCVEVNRFNAAVHTMTANGTDENGISVDIHPRGQSTDSWDKLDEELNVTLRGIIYEISVNNGSGDDMKDWKITVDINEDCFVNNAWCGTVELHQKNGAEENVQTVDLRNCDRDALNLDYHVTGNDLMLTLNADSTLIYHPSITDNEQPLSAGSSVNSGIIFYSYTDSVDLSSFTMEYHLDRGYFDNGTAFIYICLAIFWVLFLIAFLTIAIMSARYEKRLQESDRLISESLEVFTSFVDAKDPYTKGHSNRVAEYSRLIAQRMGFTEERCKQVYYIALLHDIGKCYVPDEILKKPSRLTDEEFAIIKTHTTHGAEMVKNFSSIPDIREGALYHHERYDGKGYPTGCKGEKIPLIGRIICVADAYDAMNSSRVYREKLPREVILRELEENSGTQFDPKLVEIFLDILKDGLDEETTNKQ